MNVFSARANRAFSLVEMLIVVAIIGIMAMLASPAISGFNENARNAAAQRNAQSIASISGTLGNLGIAHVLPESLGGVEATARLLREGVVVDKGPMRGQVFDVILSDEEIERASKFLDIVYDMHEIRLIYAGPTAT